MFVGLRAGLHQVHPLSIDLDQGQDVSVPDSVVQNLQSQRGVGTEPPSKPLFCVLRCDVVLPCLPRKQEGELVQISGTTVFTSQPVTHMSLLGSGLVTFCFNRSASMISLKLAFPTFFANWNTIKCQWLKQHDGTLFNYWYFILISYPTVRHLSSCTLTISFILRNMLGQLKCSI